MGIEIERKFLVRSGEWPRLGSGVRYRQGYLSVDPARCVRVRVGKGRAYLTVKGPAAGISRSEFEFEIAVGDAEQLLDELCVKPLIDKTRHRIEHAGHVWEVDEFHGDNDGLVVAEVELDNESVDPPKPHWVTEEVTGDSRYYNMRLVERPFRTWTEDGRDPPG